MLFWLMSWVNIALNSLRNVLSWRPRFSGCWVRGCYLVPVSTWRLGSCAVAGSVDLWCEGCLLSDRDGLVSVSPFASRVLYIFVDCTAFVVGNMFARAQGAFSGCFFGFLTCRCHVVSSAFHAFMGSRAIRF